MAAPHPHCNQECLVLDEVVLSHLKLVNNLGVLLDVLILPTHYVWAEWVCSMSLLVTFWDLGNILSLSLLPPSGDYLSRDMDVFSAGVPSSGLICFCLVWFGFG